MQTLGRSLRTQRNHASGSFSSARADNVRTDYNHQIDFHQFHTYCWGHVQAPNGIVQNRIKRAVSILLNQRGWQQQPDGCQVTVFAVANVKNQKELETYYNDWGGWGLGWGWGGWGMGWGPWGGFGGPGYATTETVNQKVGHIVVDLFQTSNKQLIWRGISDAQLSDKPEQNRDTLYRDIHEMFDHFPVKKK